MLRFRRSHLVVLDAVVLGHDNLNAVALILTRENSGVTERRVSGMNGLAHDGHGSVAFKQQQMPARATVYGYAVQPPVPALGGVLFGTSFNSSITPMR